MVVSPTDYVRIGTMQYKGSLPLADKEVVLTFDDGPIPPYTTRILQTLAAECVKATFFLVGRQARNFPHVVRRIHELGHTIATHSQNHPLGFSNLSTDRVAQEVEGGIAAAAAALGDRGAVAPFFRIPGLSRSNINESYLASRRLTVWSADFAADDWRHISAQAVMERALMRLANKGKGVLLLHDIQPATALALPRLLRELKERGYRVVHVVPGGAVKPNPGSRRRHARAGRASWKPICSNCRMPGRKTSDR
jgi:peptidoglycan/xylan/chitin deacetylase (PgdA/CDA1 family)